MSSSLETANHFRAALWNQDVYAQLTNEVDPVTDAEHFRPRNLGFSGNKNFWETPSPEPQLPESVIQRLQSPMDSDNPIIKAAEQLAIRIADRYQISHVLFVAILRAGVPVADWLTKMLPGSIAVATSLFIGYGIDQIALSNIRAEYPDRQIIFVDGWTGKGGVASELSQLNVGPLAVLCDPWCIADIRGTTEDLLSPSAFFTGPTTLGFSRTFTRNPDQSFAAYRFPQHYLKPGIVAAWKYANLTPSFASTVRESLRDSQPPATYRRTTVPSSLASTPLRIHSNEVCRALINSNPGEIYFLDNVNDARARYDLLLEMADHQRVPVRFNHRKLNELNARVACTLKLQS